MAVLSKMVAISSNICTPVWITFALSLIHCDMVYDGDNGHLITSAMDGYGRFYQGKENGESNDKEIARWIKVNPLQIGEPHRSHNCKDDTKYTSMMGSGRLMKAPRLSCKSPKGSLSPRLPAWPVDIPLWSHILPNVFTVRCGPYSGTKNSRKTRHPFLRWKSHG